jgi:hypothetical protein
LEQDADGLEIAFQPALDAFHLLHSNPDDGRQVVAGADEVVDFPLAALPAEADPTEQVR